MYDFLLIGCISSLMLCPLLLDEILTRRENQRLSRAVLPSQRIVHWALIQRELS